MHKNFSKQAGVMFLTGVLALAGCQGGKGDAGATGATGATGSQGPTGSTGPQGPAGPVTTTDESCMVCHAAGRIAALATVAPAPMHGLQLADSLVVSNVSAAPATDASGRMVVSFHVATSSGPFTTLADADTKFYVASLTPAPDYGTGKPRGTDTFNRWAAEGLSLTPSVFGQLDKSDAANGNYVYTSVAVLSAAPAGSASQRILFLLAPAGVNAGNAVYDFLTNGTTITPVANQHAIATDAACNQCHIARLGGLFHGGVRNIVDACVVCHNTTLPTPNMAADGADFPTFIHQIHAGVNHKALAGTGFDWSAIKFPAGIQNCAVCHNGGAKSDNWMNNPSRLACGSCHTPVDFVAGTNHPGGPQLDDSACFGCHSATAIQGYHSQIATKNQPEYKATLTIDAPKNGKGYYVVGEAPTITVILTKPDGSAVDPAIYTSASHKAGSTVATSLSGAKLYVYGPRNAPKPVLTVGAAVTPIPTQSTSLLLPSTDTNVQTGATGFKYQLKPIPALTTDRNPGTFVPGTYMIRFYAQNYGYVSDSDYVISSNAFTTIQIGTATADKKTAGDCTKCHGTGTAPWHDARHSVVVDTDECVSCHDLSGNHADALANRAHSVHSASALGDIMKIDWSPTGENIKYPVGTSVGGVRNCGVCHDSGNSTYIDNVAEFSCMGCHADNDAALSHMRQNGGKY